MGCGDGDKLLRFSNETDKSAALFIDYVPFPFSFSCTPFQDKRLISIVEVVRCENGRKSESEREGKKFDLERVQIYKRARNKKEKKKGGIHWGTPNS